MGRRLGQHFLDNPEVALRITDALSAKDSDTILEIGSGKGFLTAYLLETPARVVAVEIDKSLVDYLKTKLGSSKKLTIFNRDFMAFNQNGAEYSKICGNLPYQLTGKIIQKTMKEYKKWSLAVFMIPYAVARRAVAKSGSADYSAFSILCQSVSCPEILFKVDRSNFNPPPEIESAVVKFIRTDLLPPPLFFKIVSAAFKAKRKKLINALKNHFEITRDETRKILKEAGIELNARPHQLDIEDYKKLHELFVKYNLM